VHDDERIFLAFGDELLTRFAEGTISAVDTRGKVGWTLLVPVARAQCVSCPRNP
jgi:hypothetical protein